ncbi:MAG TPA: ferrochelatase [Candidatus Dormibacteraeota bacterium]|nr:ferrochelatase [Candidatus Dormibacteraeota bacterium]
MTSSFDAFLLVSFGGPEAREDVVPFLENVTRGRGIPRERLEEVAHHYLALDGVSPINGQNRELVDSIRSTFARRSIDLPVYWGNRNWHPYLTPTLERIHADGRRSVLAFVTSAYSSYSGCRQYREDLAAALREAGLEGRLSIERVRQYFDHPGFVTPFADGLASALAELAEAGTPAASTRVLFTTHSIPLAMADSSGPPGRFAAGGAYLAQHQAAIAAIVAAVESRGIPVPPHSLVYQSRSGPPSMPWLEPDIDEAIRAAHADGARAVVVVPVGFVSDHVEVVWDLDHEARQTCEELGVRMIRVGTPGTHAAFVEGIADLVEERLDGAVPAAASPLGPWPAVCAAGCCRNLRGDRPALGGLDPDAGVAAPS